MRALYLAEWLGERGYDAEHGLQRPWLCAAVPSCDEWLAEEPQGYDPELLISPSTDDRPLRVRQEADEMARVVCLREWLKWVEREQMRVINLEPADAPEAEVPEFEEVAETSEERAAMYAEMERIHDLPTRRWSPRRCA